MNWQIVKIAVFNLLFSSLLIYISILIYLFFRQSYLIFLPKKGKIYHTPKELSIPFEVHKLELTENQTIYLWFIPASKPTQTTILFCHGNAGNLEDRLEILKVLYQLGTNLVLFDYRGYGESKGKPSETNTYTDAELIYNFLRKQKKIPANKIIIFGRSLGGGVACELAFRHPETGALILDSTFISMPKIAQKYYPYVPVFFLIRHRYENIKKLPKIKIPKLIIHSKEDDIVPFYHGQKLFETACEPKSFLILQKGGHRNCFIEEEKKYLEEIKNFLLKFHLL